MWSALLALCPWLACPKRRFTHQLLPRDCQGPSPRGDQSTNTDLERLANLPAHTSAVLFNYQKTGQIACLIKFKPTALLKPPKNSFTGKLYAGHTRFSRFHVDRLPLKGISFRSFAILKSTSSLWCKFSTSRTFWQFLQFSRSTFNDHVLIQVNSESNIWILAVR